MMNNMLTAKPIVKNKFWIVERDGQKVATIQSTPTGVTYVQDSFREQFVSIKLLSDKYKIQFDKATRTKKAMTSFEVNGYPCDQKPHNALFNVSKKLPVYTKTDKSKSFYCAGHYLVQVNLEYIPAYCPKSITLNRYKFAGPFQSKGAAKEFAKTLKKENQ